jgi:hypothetical protein
LPCRSRFPEQHARFRHTPIGGDRVGDRAVEEAVERVKFIGADHRGKSSRGALSFTYGLNAEESAPYLKLPPGRALSEDGTNLQLVAAAPYPLR